MIENDKLQISWLTCHAPRNENLLYEIAALR